MPVVSPTNSPVIKPTPQAPAPRPVAVPREITTEAPVPAPVQVPLGAWKPVVMPTAPEPIKEPAAEPAKETTEEPIFEADHSDEECSIPPEIDCSAHNINYGRMCRSTYPCCESERSDTSFCWETYDTLGLENIASACYHCCLKATGVAKCVGPPTPRKRDDLPKTIQCSDYGDARRMCKANSCCTNPRSTSSYCKLQYATYGDIIEQICHYCCSTPQTVGPPRRILRSEPDEEAIPEGAKVFDVHGHRFLLREENFEESDEDEQEYFDQIYSGFQRRSLVEGVHEEDYEDIEWFAYEWLLKGKCISCSQAVQN